MVQQYQSPVRVYKHPFELVMQAYERRFPRCPQIPVVVDCEVIEDDISEDCSVRITKRRCKLNVEAPYILKKLIGVDFVFFVQTNELNKRERCLNIEAYNESFSNRVVVLEKCRYFVHPENAEWTCFEQSASLDIKNFFGFEHTMEKLAMKQYSQNIAKGKEIIEYFVNELELEGITHVPRWTEDNDCKERRLADTQNSCELSLGASASTFNNGKSISPVKKEKNVQFQLETDYIQRYLGELTVLQESRLVQLRKCVGDLLKGKVPSEATLLRFLRARDFNVDKARELLSASLLWRKKHQVDRILSEYEMPQVVRDYFPGGWHHHDRDGRPLYLLRLGQMDVKGLLKAVGEDGLLKLTLHVCEEGLRRMEQATQVEGRPISTWCLLVDLDGLNMRHLWRPGIKALLRIIEIVEANYPETMGRVLVTRAPRMFPILWTIVGTFIDDNTTSKFLFYSGSDYLQAPGGLADYIPDGYVPDFLGGSCKPDVVSVIGFIPHHYYMNCQDGCQCTRVHEGSLVPKSLYMSDSWLEKEGCSLSEDSLYHSVSLGKGQLHEVLVVNEDPGSVLTWDFDVMRQDVTFSVFRTSAPIQSRDSSGALQTFQHMIEHEQRSVIDKSWKENQDYYKVEPTVTCHDGESIQGSHVMGHCGTYILQWKFFCDHQLDLLDTLTAHKAQVMFFYEILCASDYRGSMTSLQSGNSGFSALSSRSLASSCPSR